MASKPIHLIGNAHLDPAWMWRMSEGFEAFAATCRSALARIQEFPDFLFTCSSAAHYEFIEQVDPKLFKEIQKAVADGRWSIVGGWWVEADCNLPSGESFVRQALLGQRYFQSRFGKIATVGYNVDSFGHNANLPQLLRKAGLNSYVFMRPQQDERQLEAALFQWEAPSCDQVTTYRLPLHYSNHQYSVREKLRLLHFFDLFTPRQPWMIFYGVGNHGGGPTIKQIKEVIAAQEEGNVVFSDPQKFFAIVDIDSLPIAREEMQPHAIGCYSAHSEIKRLNRRAENALGVAESMSVLAKVAGVNLEKPYLERAWKNICFNQFHDILGGVAIKEACDDAISLYREAIAIADRATRTVFQSIASRINTSDAIENLIVFNPSAFAREELVEFEMWTPEASEQGKILRTIVLVSSTGERIPTQKVTPSGKIGEDRVRFIGKVKVPALGWSRFRIERNASIESGTPITIAIDQIQSSTLSIDLSEGISDTEDTSFDGLDDTDIFLEKKKQPISNPDFSYVRPLYLQDYSDTWSHGIHSFPGDRSELSDQISEIVESGPIRATVRIWSEGYDSDLWEDITVTEGNDHIDIKAKLDWHQPRSILKFRFAHGCTNPVARYEIPYASIERPIGVNEWPGQIWIDVSEQDGSRGLAVISDSKYSYSVDDTYIYVIAARSALYAHHVPPHVEKDVEALPVELLDTGWQEFTFRIIPHTGNWKAANLTKRSEALLRSLIAHVESGHSGDLPSQYSVFEHSSENIVVGALKIAEDSNDDVILRAIEQHGKERDCKFIFAGKTWSAKFSPFEIKSFKIDADGVTEIDLLERPI